MLAYPVTNLLSGSLNHAQGALLGQVTGDATTFDSILRSFYLRPDCVDKVTLSHGKEALGAFGGKVASAMSSTPRGSVALTPQEITIVQDIRACLDEGSGIAWTPIIVIGGLLGVALLVAQPWSR